VSLAAAALQFSLRDPRITSTIVGVTRRERIRQTLALAALPIPDEVWAHLAALAIPERDRQRLVDGNDIVRPDEPADLGDAAASFEGMG
jgi:diketogulonate reductase-like aldo/keto reductase